MRTSLPEFEFGKLTWHPHSDILQVTAIIGAGVLGLPFAFSYLGCAHFRGAAFALRCDTARFRLPQAEFHSFC